jgi:hypothetical protein
MHPTLMLMYLDAHRADRDREVRDERRFRNRRTRGERS